MRRAIIIASSFLSVLMCASIANAQASTETYTYDALGRLIKVETDNGSNDGVVSEIAYDDAGNRVSFDTSGANGSSSSPPPPAGSAEDALEADFVGRTNSGMWDLRTAANAGSFVAANITGGLPSMVGTNGLQLEAVDAVTGGQFVSNDQVQVAATGSFVVYALIRKDPADTTGFIIDDGWPNQTRYDDGSTAQASGVDIRFYANGAFGSPISNRDALHDTLDDDEFHAVKIGTLSLNGTLNIGRTFAGMEADVVAIVAVDISEVTDLQATEALIANWFGEIHPSAYVPPPPPPDPQGTLVSEFAARTNSGMWDLRAATNAGSFSAANIAGGLPALTATNGAQLQSVDSVTGAEIVSGQQIQVASTGDFVVYALVRKDLADATGFIIDDGWPNQTRYDDGSTAQASGVDIRFYSNGAFGAPISNRDALHDTLDDDEFHALKIGTLSLNGTLNIGRLSSGMEGDIVAIVAVDLSEVTDLQATEALIANWFDEISPP